MARKNRIQLEVPPDVRQELDAQIADGRKSIDQLKAWLEEKGHDDISRSGVARYVVSREDVIAKIRESREIAEAIGTQLGPDDGEGSRNAQMTEMLQSIIHSGMIRMLADPDAEVSSLDIGRMAKATQSAIAAQKVDVDRRINAAKLEAARAASKETAEKAAEAAVGAMKKAKGLTKETVETIRRAVLGVAT